MLKCAINSTDLDIDGAAILRTKNSKSAGGGLLEQDSLCHSPARLSDLDMGAKIWWEIPLFPLVPLSRFLDRLSRFFVI